MLLSTLFTLAYEILTSLWGLAISIITILQMVKLRLREDNLICPRLPSWLVGYQTSNSGRKYPEISFLAIEC